MQCLFQYIVLFALYQDFWKLIWKIQAKIIIVIPYVLVADRQKRTFFLLTSPELKVHSLNIKQIPVHCTLVLFQILAFQNSFWGNI